jgi:hypothetical protein
MYTSIASSMRARLARKHVLALCLFPAICLLVFWHAALSSSTSTSAVAVPRIQAVRTGRGGSTRLAAPKAYVYLELTRIQRGTFPSHG